MGLPVRVCGQGSCPTDKPGTDQRSSLWGEWQLLSLIEATEAKEAKKALSFK